MNCQFWPEISFCLNEVETERLRLTKSSMNLDTLTAAREKINYQVDQLRLSFEQALDKNFASLALFAIVAYIDEEVQRHVLETGQGNWAPLQKDFYGAYNAGELFYETIDKIIDDPQVPPIVPQLFYFILKKGFQGKYRDSKTHIEKYLDILKSKIPVTTPSKTMGSTVERHADIKRRFKKWHYYTGVGIATACLLITLYISSSYG